VFDEFLKFIFALSLAGKTYDEPQGAPDGRGRVGQISSQSNPLKLCPDHFPGQLWRLEGYQ
jgi:hypothetical protein